MIQNLLKGSNQNKNEEGSKVEEPTQPSTKKTVQHIHESESMSHIKEDNVSSSNQSTEFRRFMTPQLSAEFSQFSGLSLRLEDDKVAAKLDRTSKFPLKNGRPLVIGVCGGNCAGKMDLVNFLVKNLGEKRCTILKQENFYFTVPEQEAIEDYNYDDPGATDWEFLQMGLDALLYHKKSFHTPIYNFKLNKRDLKTEEIWPNPIIIVEGLLIFHIEGIRKRLDLKIFLDTDDDIRLSRRIMKGYLKLGRDVDSIIERYKKFVKPCHETYVLPSRKFADIIIPNFGSSVCEELDSFKTEDEDASKNNTKTPAKTNLPLELLVEQIKFQLEEMNKFRLFQ